MHIPNSGEAVREMLLRVGVSSVDELFADIPESVRMHRPLKVSGPLSEWELTRRLHAMAGENRSLGEMLSFLGAGCYHHHVPAAVKHLLARSEFYTAYTPYQPEVSQGTLQAIFEYQTYVVRLTGMEVANASMYDGATALAEAVLMAQRVRRGRKKILLSQSVHPEYRQVVRTFVASLNLEVEEPPITPEMELDWEAVAGQLDTDTSCLIIQNPNFFGTIEDMNKMKALADQARKLEVLFIVAVVEPLSLGVLIPPGRYGADIVVAEGQSLGIPPSFGGPHLGMFATRSALVRQMPGRLVGETEDRAGHRGYVLTLATREQHIRRERATSNICTNQSLCAVAAAIFLSLLGRCGMQRLSALNIKRTRQAMEALSSIEGFEIVQNRCFNEFVAKSPIPPAELNERLSEKGILGGLDLEKHNPSWERLWLLCCTEQIQQEDVAALVQAIREVLT